MKKAQISYFIIIGIVALFLIAILFILIPKQDNEPVVPLTEKSKINVLVTGCLDQITGAGVRIIGAQGGYLIPDEPKIISNNLTIPYGYYNNKNTLVLKPIMETELANYIDAALLECVDNFSSLNSDVTFDIPKSTAKINPYSIDINTEFNVRSNGQLENKFNSQVNAPLGMMHDTAFMIIEQIDPDWVDLSYLSMLPTKVNVEPIDGDTTAYYLTYDDYLFTFASKVTANSVPILKLPNNVTMKKGIPFMLQINCSDPEDDLIDISSSSVVFPVLPDGKILTIMNIPGNYTSIIRCSDDHYNVAEQVLEIRVVE